jgi:nicotinamide phosphoribosyltransferase
MYELKSDEDDILWLTDSYKPTQWSQLPDHTTEIEAYFESRGGKTTDTVFFGLQPILKKYFVGEQVKAASVKEMRDFCGEHFMGHDYFNYNGWMHIVQEHGGRLPLEISAVPEGSVIPTSNILMKFKNTCQHDSADRSIRHCAWLTTYMESLGVHVWFPSSVATLTREFLKAITHYVTLTGGTAEDAQFMLQNFNFRGSQCVDSARISGAAHLLNFKGTDTMVGIRQLMKYYGVRQMPGFSVYATEHSVVCAYGQTDAAETAAYRHIMNGADADAIVAVVSDYRDIAYAVDHIWGETLRDEVKARKGKVVIRPDSGHPPTIVRQSINALGQRFGFSTNAAGYRELLNVSLLQGDGVDLNMCHDIYMPIVAEKWAATNVSLGSGIGICDVTRDTWKYKFMESSAVIDGQQRDVFKAPKTDSGKKSKKGKLALIETCQGFRTVQEESLGEGDPLKQNLVVPVFRDGDLLVDQHFDDVRPRAALAYT